MRWLPLLLLACSRPPVVVAPSCPQTAKPVMMTMEIERTLLAGFLERLTADGYGPLKTDVRPKSLFPTIELELESMEWHGNHVGDRWKTARVLCATCDGYEFGIVDLFDLNVARIDVWTMIPRVNPALPASDVCNALAQTLDAGPCHCGSDATINEAAKWAMPAGPRAKEPCDAAERASTLFVVRRGDRFIHGALVVDKERTDVSLLLRGSAWARFLAANDK